MSRRTHTKKRPTNTKPATLRAVLPVRPATPGPEFISEQQMNAAYAARLNGLPLIPITAWTPQPNGAVRAHLSGGTSLTHQPAGFTAHTPCPNGAHHHAPVTSSQGLRDAITTAAHCTDLHGQPRTLTLHQAAVTAEDTQQLSRDDIDAGLTADHNQAQPHPAETTPGYDIALAAAEAHGHAAAQHQNQETPRA
ncbi:hypothetical protein PV677_36290 [Streptomyces sp. DE06-01C]|uniref:hypothetical protein n=1 Tax=Streptomyces sp. DE06-01C TaxID=3028656 RepID=UPI0029C4E671|nr:hypothetical protein [Streptomyces sp. DE06-01C]MDX5526132.1 hypothetical protein [Streptomyces sp. DE06-01C]